MPAPLLSVSAQAPGFFGLNSEQAAAKLTPRFATVLQNAVFDDSGRIAAREGFSKLADGTPDTVDRCFVWRQDRTTTKLMTVGDAAGTATLYEMTGAGLNTFTSRGALNGTTDKKLVNVNGYLVSVEQGQTPQVWDGTGSAANFAAATGVTVNPTGGVAHSAFGRLFITDSDGKTVYGSQLQPDPKTTGINWDNWFIDTTGNSGATASDGWTFGRDFITAIGSVGDYLVIFGRDSILMFQDVNGTLTLFTGIAGVGCVSQHTVQNTGDDLIFLSSTGVRSLRRTIESEQPELNDYSAHVRSDLIDLITLDSAVSAFDPLRGFYLISDGVETFYFDTKSPLPNGALRATTWTLGFNYASYGTDDNRLFFARSNAVGEYSGYQDDGAGYVLKYLSSWVDFNAPNIKLLKKIRAVFAGGDGYTPTFLWALNFNTEQQSSATAQALPVPSGAEWGDAEWGEAEWGAFVEQINQRSVPAGGSSKHVQIGVQMTINGAAVGIQEIEVLAKAGRLSHV